MLYVIACVSALRPSRPAPACRALTTARVAPITRRRETLGSLATASVFAIFPLPSVARKEDDLSIADLLAARKAAFSAVREEVAKGESWALCRFPPPVSPDVSSCRHPPADQAAQIHEAVSNRSYERLLEFTKVYDLSFRKGTLGDARKSLLSKSGRAEGTLITNAVTFDLIAINKAARKGGDGPAADAALARLDADVRDLLALESGDTDVPE